jgi:Zn-dependent peptidase ImmA (M78 family)
MLSHYQTSPLEQWIEDLYQRLSVTKPEQLHIGELAAKLGIWVYYMDMGSMAIENQGAFSINIDRRISAKEQWGDFLHELCHVLRHSGNQMAMPSGYVHWQEQDAANFQLYAAMPFSMIAQLNLPQKQGELIDLLAEEFHVTHRLAAARLEQIQRRTLQGILDQEYRTRVEELSRSVQEKAQQSEETLAILDKLQKQLQKKGEARSGKARSRL